MRDHSTGESSRGVGGRRVGQGRARQRGRGRGGGREGQGRAGREGGGPGGVGWGSRSDADFGARVEQEPSPLPETTTVR